MMQFVARRRQGLAAPPSTGRKRSLRSTRLACELLEDRRLLSIAASSDAEAAAVLSVQAPAELSIVPTSRTAPVGVGTTSASASGSSGATVRGVRWQSVYKEGFEGAFPGPWQVWSQSDVNPATWNATTHAKHSGKKSIYCAASEVNPPGPYEASAESWIAYGPFDLSQASQAKMTFWLSLKSELYDDSLFYGVSTDGEYFSGEGISGNTGGWRQFSLDLTDECGQSQVWVAFVFGSDEDSTTGVGAYVDDVALSKYEPPVDLKTLDVYAADPSDITKPITSIGEGQQVELVCKYNYSGPPSADTQTVRMALDGQAVAESAVELGRPGTGYSHTPWTATLGTHSLTATLDVNSDVQETKETNNVRNEKSALKVKVTGGGQISGTVWDDLDNDGVWDKTGKNAEPGLSGFTLFLDAEPQNGVYDPGERTATTDANGKYTFYGLAAGAYHVGQVAPEEGWARTFPRTPFVAAAASTSGPSTLGTPDDLSSGRVVATYIDGGSTSTADTSATIVTAVPDSAKVLTQVPTSTWTYGCSATSAGMLFGYYDRTGYENMYAGPANGGVAPLTNLGQGDDPAHPIAGASSIIATQNGFDGRTTRGHVDDYWKSYGAGGPDPWEGHWSEHTWGDCTADFMGTNQWKWDYDLDGEKDTVIDGGTIFFGSADNNGNPSPEPLYDYIPWSRYGLPTTEGCHGLRLYAESRGYTVEANFTQYIDTVAPGGFSFADLQAEIDAGRPVITNVVGHTMIIVGYDAGGAADTIYIHDTWDNRLHSMTWGGSYAYDWMIQEQVVVLRLSPPESFGTQSASLGIGKKITGVNFGNRSLYTGLYDFGTRLSKLEGGYARVTEKTALGGTATFGWLPGSGSVKSADRGTGSNLDRDVNYTADATFAANVGNGTYRVSLLLGDRKSVRDNVCVSVEGTEETGINTAKGELVWKTYTVDVADGQLTVRLWDAGGGADPYAAIAAMQVLPVAESQAADAAQPASLGSAPLQSVAVAALSAPGQEADGEVASVAAPAASFQGPAASPATVRRDVAAMAFPSDAVFKRLADQKGTRGATIAAGPLPPSLLQPCLVAWKDLADHAFAIS